MGEWCNEKKVVSVQIIKRDNTVEDYNFEKIKTAINVSQLIE